MSPQTRTSLTTPSQPGRPGPAPPLVERYRAVREATDRLAAPLAVEDQVVQSMPDASPTKWHLAHTTWFFETFVVAPTLPGYASPEPQFAFLFNSYYNAVGPQYFRPHRGLVTRPTVEQVRRYRSHVDQEMVAILSSDARAVPEDVVELGLNHEQQHQELILTDLKHLFWHNPLYPAYAARRSSQTNGTRPVEWLERRAGVYEIGHRGEGFAFDNEGPRHRVYLQSFRLANRLVTCEEYLAFMQDGGYTRPELWLSDGWAAVQEHGWRAPLYWLERDGGWWQFTLQGLREVAGPEPVCHVSYYEADAYARWAGARLLTEAEWEVVAAEQRIVGNFADDGVFHPVPAGVAAGDSGPAQVFGDVWEWTGSAYLGYPGYRPPAGATGEYNGKFMCNQFVLRGGSCATPRSHVRPTYRNFFPPQARWQFTGIRLAMDA